MHVEDACEDDPYASQLINHSEKRRTERERRSPERYDQLTRNNSSLRTSAAITPSTKSVETEEHANSNEANEGIEINGNQNERAVPIAASTKTFSANSSSGPNPKRRKYSFEERFEQLMAFKAKYGHCDIRQTYGDFISLSIWCSKIRSAYKAKSWKGKVTNKLSIDLSLSNIKRLEKAGFDWRPISSRKEGYVSVARKRSSSRTDEATLLSGIGKNVTRTAESNKEKQRAKRVRRSPERYSPPLVPNPTSIQAIATYRNVCNNSFNGKVRSRGAQRHHGMKGGSAIQGASSTDGNRERNARTKYAASGASSMLYQKIVDSNHKLFLIKFTPQQRTKASWYLVQVDLESTNDLNKEFKSNGQYYCSFLAKHPEDRNKTDQASRWWPDWYRYSMCKKTGAIIFGCRVLFPPGTIPDSKKYVEWAELIDLGSVDQYLYGPFEFEQSSSSHHASMNKVSGSTWKILENICQQNSLPLPSTEHNLNSENGGIKVIAASSQTLEVTSSRCDPWSKYTFEDRFEQLMAFKAIHGHFDVTRKHVEFLSLSYWCEKIRRNYNTKSSNLPQSHIRRLKRAGFNFNLKSNKRCKPCRGDDSVVENSSLPPATLTVLHSVTEENTLIESDSDKPRAKRVRREHRRYSSFVGNHDSSFQITAVNLAVEAKKIDNPDNNEIETSGSYPDDDNVNELSSTTAQALFGPSVGTRSKNNTFDEHFEQLMAFKSKYGKCYVTPNSNVQFKHLAYWCGRVRRCYREFLKGDHRLYKRMNMKDSNIERLDRAGFDWGPSVKTMLGRVHIERKRARLHINSSHHTTSSGNLPRATGENKTNANEGISTIHGKPNKEGGPIESTSTNTAIEENTDICGSPIEKGDSIESDSYIALDEVGNQTDIICHQHSKLRKKCNIADKAIVINKKLPAKSQRVEVAVIQRDSPCIQSSDSPMDNHGDYKRMGEDENDIERGGSILSTSSSTLEVVSTQEIDTLTKYSGALVHINSMDEGIEVRENSNVEDSIQIASSSPLKVVAIQRKPTAIQSLEVQQTTGTMNKGICISGNEGYYLGKTDVNRLQGSNATPFLQTCRRRNVSPHQLSSEDEKNSRIYISQGCDKIHGASKPMEVPVSQVQENISVAQNKKCKVIERSAKTEAPPSTLGEVETLRENICDLSLDAQEKSKIADAGEVEGRVPIAVDSFALLEETNPITADDSPHNLEEVATQGGGLDDQSSEVQERKELGNGDACGNIGDESASTEAASCLTTENAVPIL